MPDEETAPVDDETSGDSLVADTPLKEIVGPVAHEKAWWQSKKFIAFLAAEGGFFALMGAMLYTQDMDKLGENIAFMVLAVTSGVLSSFYIGGQALVDRYVRVAALTMGKGKE